MSGEKNSFDNFEELYTNCYWLVYRYVRHMIEKDLAAAEDVTQEVFLVAYQKWQEVRRHPNQKGFLLLTAKNKLKKWYEQQGKIQTEASRSLLQSIHRQRGTVDILHHPKEGVHRDDCQS